MNSETICTWKFADVLIGSYSVVSYTVLVCGLESFHRPRDKVLSDKATMSALSALVSHPVCDQRFLKSRTDLPPLTLARGRTRRRHSRTHFLLNYRSRPVQENDGRHACLPVVFCVRAAGLWRTDTSEYCGALPDKNDMMTARHRVTVGLSFSEMDTENHSFNLTWVSFSLWLSSLKPHERESGRLSQNLSNP